MSRKRLASVRLFSNGIPTPNMQPYQYEYYRPGCYYIPQVVRQVTPYIYTYTDHWQPYCNTATYVVDRFGRVNYPSDLEYQLHVPRPLHPQHREVIYKYYDDGEAEISSLPHIEEDDYTEEQDARERKRKRLDDKDRNGIPSEFNDRNVYRSKEGYLVEEPSDHVLDSV